MDAAEPGRGLWEPRASGQKPPPELKCGVPGGWSANRKLRGFLVVGSESPMMQELLRTIRCRLPRIADGVLVRRAFALG